MSILQLPNPERWMSQALCAQVGGDCWWPEKGQAEKVRDAKRICALCEVRPQCADWAVRVGDNHAVLGGFSHYDRRRMNAGEVIEYTPPVRKRRPGEAKVHVRTCGECGEEFGGHPHAKYCGLDCKRSVERRRHNDSRRKGRPTKDAA